MRATQTGWQICLVTPWCLKKRHKQNQSGCSVWLKSRVLNYAVILFFSTAFCESNLLATTKTCKTLWQKVSATTSSVDREAGSEKRQFLFRLECQQEILRLWKLAPDLKERNRLFLFGKQGLTLITSLSVADGDVVGVGSSVHNHHNLENLLYSKVESITLM